MSSHLKTLNRKKNLWREIFQSRYIYLLLIPGLLFFAIFSYGSMYGLLLAFKKFNASLGIFGSPWVGLKHFERLFITPDFLTAVKNTLTISFGRLLIEFPFPIILAIMLSEMKHKGFQKVYQTLYTFPNFISWVIVGSIMVSFFDNNGPVNAIIQSLGHEKANILANGSTFRLFLFGTGIWKGAGWSSIIYLAAISGINPELYESALIDGASRLRRIWHITLPGIIPTITVLFILAVGNVMNGGFDQIFNLQNPVVRPVSDIIDTYVYRITFQAVPDYGFSTAVGMFKSVINLGLLFVANKFTKIISGNGLLG